MPHGPEFGIGRVMRDGRLAGLAFAVGGRAVLTCAHVINEALGRGQRETRRPDEDVRLLLEFPFGGAPDDTPIAYATVQMWGPDHGDFDRHDLAGLMLRDDLPDGVTPLEMIDRPARGGTVVQFWGPGRHRNGAHVEAVLAGAVDHGRYQVEQRVDGTFQAVGGFSGGPVWTQGEARVAGVLCAAAGPGEGGDAYLLGAEVAIACWPEVLYSPPPCPYRGLDAFGPDDAALFFGRDKVIADLVDRAGRTPVVTVTGPSGSGKSSVVAAGLVAELRRHAALAHLTIRPGRGVLSALATAFAARTSPGPPIPPAELEAWEKRLADRGLADAMRVVRASAGVQQVVVVLDQFEQILDDDHPPEQRRTMLRLLAELVTAPREPGCLFVITLRHDLFGQLIAEDREFGPYLQSSAVMLYPLGPEELRAAVVEPARLADPERPVRVEPTLVAQIVDDFSGQAGELPLVQFALTRLWERLDEPRLTLNSYASLGGARTALTDFADSCVDRLPAEQQDIARRVFCRLGLTDGIALGRRLLRTELPEEHWEIAARLAGPDTRLLVIGGDSYAGVEYVEIAHEILLRAWPRLREWLAADREFLIWLRRTEDQCAQWIEDDRDERLLLREPLLERAERQLADRESETRHLRTFIQASHNLVIQDALTGLPNRQALTRGIADVLRQRRGDQVVAVLMVDIRRFREVNRYAGHGVGDRLLTRVGEGLRNVTPVAGHVGRLGGDEFGVVARLPDEAAALSLAEEIRAAIECPVVVDGHSFDINVAIGVAMHPAHGEEPETLLQRATMAAHTAKDNDLAVQLFQPFELGTELRRILDGDGQPIRVLYEPIVSLSSGDLVGVRAAPFWVTWAMPTLGPGDLAPLAAEAGLAGRLFDLVLARAFHELRELPPMGVSVAVAQAVVAEGAAADRIRGLLTGSGLFAPDLTVEISEETLMRQDPGVVQSLRRVGARVAVADFGMGYSSLSYLRNFTIDELKIHPGFVQDITTSAQQLTMVDAIIKLASSLDVKVTAEGVDIEAIAGPLRASGCDFGQGQLFGPPMSLAELQEWIAARR
ncbi:EAL domain-containing protein [Actinoplanes sp. NPDC048796]|uniref:nSTAND1 domain-containing NTPase n=1 Tax=unclassified Actinoplanes TaxID=2626549 RepID=UPI0033F12D1E